ncbi:sensor histidine kinase [Rariglobus hedericola]|uniref:histidine kinase n=1 Tax=Rariglobus hedericola TaxID=2597822 RepID=A0A556QJZ8_9BACT|nr:ATP-binding protein [Rariglobus hedericola]TSJ76966.1 cell wall metabolism sensor histidine kinase WalK [Rariglobus hedericola]
MLRNRLYLGLLPLLLLFIAVGAVGTYLYRDLAGTFERSLTVSYRAMIGGYEMREAATLMAGAITHGDRGDPIGARKTYEEQRSRFRRHFMEQSLASADSARAERMNQLDAAFLELDTLGRARLDGAGDASIHSLRDTETALFKTLKAIERIAEGDYAEVAASAERARGLSHKSINFLVAAMVVAILLSVFLSYRLARSLLRPIQALQTSAAAFGEGKFDDDVPVTSSDELGDLARTFNIMADKLRRYRDAMNERVSRSRRTMEATLTSTPDPLFVINADGSHEVRNPAAEAIAALPELAGGLPVALEAPLKQVLASGTHYLPTDYDQVVTVHVDGGERHYLPRILAIGDSLTGFGGAAVILQDVTKFRLLDDVKGNLVSTVSHELKTPLTSLIMAVHMLLEESFGPLTEKQRYLVETSRDNAERLLRILNDLLDLSRLEGGASRLNRRPVSVAPLLDDMAREMTAIIEAAGQTITVRADAVLTEVNVDPERVRHVFINLLTNASKYSGEGTEITLYAEPAPDAFVRFGVRDQGPGIPPESMGHIFDRFYRVPDQAKKGAGLGLTIAREIVVAHGGSIACASNAGKGSDFYFLLPVGNVTADAAG